MLERHRPELSRDFDDDRNPGRVVVGSRDIPAGVIVSAQHDPTIRLTRQRTKHIRSTDPRNLLKKSWCAGWRETDRRQLIGEESPRSSEPPRSQRTWVGIPGNTGMRQGRPAASSPRSIAQLRLQMTWASLGKRREPCVVIETLSTPAFRFVGLRPTKKDLRAARTHRAQRLDRP